MKKSKAPIAEKIRKKLLKHGHLREDPYYWLKQRDDKKVLDYLKEENRYTEEVMEPVSKLKEDLFAELTARIREDDRSVPYRYRGYWYFTQFEKGREYPLYYRRKDTADAKEELMLDVNKLAEGASYCELAGFSISPDNRLMAYALDRVGRRQYIIRVRDMEQGVDQDFEIENTAGDMEWDRSASCLYYVSIDPETLRNDKVWRFRLSTSEKQLVFSEENEAFEVEIEMARSEKYLFIHSESKNSSEVQLIDRADPDARPLLFHSRGEGHLYSLDHFNGHFFILSNRDAINFRLLIAAEDRFEPEHWKEIIPHRSDVLLEDFELFNDFIVTEERSEGLLTLLIRKPDGSIDHQISFDEAAYLANIYINPEPDTSVLRYYYSSLTTPATIIDYDMKSREKKIRKVQEVPDYDPGNYISERIWARSHDGTRVPVSLVRRKDTPLDATAPLLLYGYGSYGISIDAAFNHARLSLLDRGWIYAIAHVRGGEEMGRAWYELEGRLLKKMNTFYDFIACASHLCDQGYTSKERLFAMGGSAGGLLIGAVINLRPDLFRGVVAAVPFVDVLTTMLDDRIPLTTQEYEEWGNPEEKEYYDYILRYSPYDNIKDRDYPAVLASTGYYDSQVQYWEPAKWVARLRAHQQGSSPILLHVNFEAGHGGASGRYEAYREIALYYAFLMGVLEGKIQGHENV